MRRKRISVAVLSWTALIATLALGSAAASATSGTLTILADTVLTEDHTGDIIVGADNVTLDCNGHGVSPDGVATFGILVSAKSGVTVEKCDVSGFDQGVVVEAGSTGIHLSGNTANSNGEGFRIDSSSSVTLLENTANNNDSWGFILSNGTVNSTMYANVASNNALIGFALDIASNNELKDNRASGNQTNFNIVSKSNGNSLTGNISEGGGFGGAGFTLADDSNSNTLTGNTSTGGVGPGFVVQDSSDDNVYVGNLSTDNGGAGFAVWLGSSKNSYTNNAGHRNGDFGFMVGTDAGTDNTFSGNICIRNVLAPSDPPGLCDPSGTFSDDDGNTFEFSIEWLAGEGITKGCNPPTNTLFCPNDNVTRGQMAAFLARALGYSDDGGGNIFTDTVGHTFEGAINKLATAGVTKGCNPPTNSLFCPDDFVTRGQMAAFLVRALGYTDDGGGDLFIDDDGHVFEGAIDKLGTAGVTKGCNPPTNDRFCPDDLVTRAQMAGFLKRALD